MPGVIACELGFKSLTDDSTSSETCGNFVFSPETDMTEGATGTAMTTMEVYLDPDVGYLVGVKYCYIPVEHGISWSQYMEWMLQHQPEWHSSDDY